jgi:hypothetical protein
MTEPADPGVPPMAHDPGVPPVAHAEYCRRKAAQLRRLAALPHAPHDRGTLLELATRLQAAADAIDGDPPLRVAASVAPGPP